MSSINYDDYGNFDKLFLQVEDGHRRRQKLAEELMREWLHPSDKGGYLDTTMFKTAQQLFLRFCPYKIGTVVEFVEDHDLGPYIGRKEGERIIPKGQSGKIIKRSYSTLNECFRFSLRVEGKTYLVRVSEHEITKALT